MKRAAIITASDSGYRGEREDLSLSLIHISGLRLMMTVKKLRLMAMLSNSHRSNTGFFFFCYRIRAEFFLSIRFMRVSGKKKRLLRTIRLLSISVTSGRR